MDCLFGGIHRKLVKAAVTCLGTESRKSRKLGSAPLGSARIITAPSGDDRGDRCRGAGREPTR